VAGEVLRPRLDDEVGAVLQGPAERRRGERVVDNTFAARAGRSATAIVGFEIVSR
jgi:hypothetical protein